MDTPNNGLPSAPSDGAFTYISATSGCLVWGVPEDDGGAPITTYLLTLTPEGETPTEHRIEAPNHQYTLETLVYGVSIHATVKASNTNGNTYGPEFVFPTILPLLPPPNPVLSATATSVSPGTAQITWQNPEVVPEGTPYSLVTSTSTNPSDPLIEIGTQSLAETSCTFTELNPESEYYFTIQIVNQVGRSPVATTNTVSFLEPPA
jgi:hypothetical protein